MVGWLFITKAPRQLERQSTKKNQKKQQNTLFSKWHSMSQSVSQTFFRWAEA
jgi:type II restriction/modification system DNA methylase subunit YeeA